MPICCFSYFPFSRGQDFGSVCSRFLSFMIAYFYFLIQRFQRDKLHSKPSCIHVCLSTVPEYDVFIFMIFTIKIKKKKRRRRRRTEAVLTCIQNLCFEQK